MFYFIFYFKLKFNNIITYTVNIENKYKNI